MEILKVLWFNYLVHAVDILIVAYIFYGLLLLIKDTRAVQVVLGLVVLMVATILSTEVLHLPTLSWLLEKFWIGAVVILVVVFQPEIRSALAQLGSRRWGKIFLPQGFKFVAELVDAVKECSQKQIGALIVIEQETGLKTYIETGVVLNSEITRELVLTIFAPRSPLHDGAVIIKNEKLAAARCLLPLTHEPVFLDGRGTRHRAAVGLSEISDAIIIVVSEETGKISFVTAGKLEPNVDPEELKRRLVDVFKQKKDSLL